MTEALAPALLGYGMGSLPIAFLLTSRLKGIDLRRVGSGNVGAANVHRTAGLRFALLVVAIDLAKGAGSVLVAARLAAGPEAPVTAGVAAIVGHIYPVWLRFRGGKGVATACGVFALLAPAATALAATIFVITVWLSRYVSLGSVVATAVLPALAWALDSPRAVVVGGTLAALVIIPRHFANLARVADGTERRLGQRA
jgi:acyl phosphate:glycerol-3-phosphate acyltransferase